MRGWLIGRDMAKRKMLRAKSEYGGYLSRNSKRELMVRRMRAGKENECAKCKWNVTQFTHLAQPPTQHDQRHAPHTMHETQHDSNQHGPEGHVQNGVVVPAQDGAAVRETRERKVPCLCVGVGVCKRGEESDVRNELK